MIITHEDGNPEDELAKAVSFFAGEEGNENIAVIIITITETDGVLNDAFGLTVAGEDQFRARNQKIVKTATAAALVAYSREFADMREKLKEEGLI